MGFLDRLFGRTEEPARPVQDVPPARPAADEDERAIERYRYVLRTAPPAQIEQAHAEAFSKLTPDQRRQVLADLSDTVPPQERAASDNPSDLARMATRAEMRQPGTLERSLGRGGPGLGGMVAGGLLASVAGAFIGTAIAQAMFDDVGADGGDGGDAGADAGGGDAGGDFGGGDFGGDFGGGDFGGF
jgi:hypothetical protein